ncbi:hypothetical protein DFH06DRAFT_1467835 [Mycena polygramma]|nr:hypothetical protein DFH06DRAFT_1467835 [Mycena polygramma]
MLYGRLPTARRTPGPRDQPTLLPPAMSPSTLAEQLADCTFEQLFSPAAALPLPTWVVNEIGGMSKEALALAQYRGADSWKQKVYTMLFKEVGVIASGTLSDLHKMVIGNKVHLENAAGALGLFNVTNLGDLSGKDALGVFIVVLGKAGVPQDTQAAVAWLAKLFAPTLVIMRTNHEDRLAKLRLKPKQTRGNIDSREKKILRACASAGQAAHDAMLPAAGPSIVPDSSAPKNRKRKRTEGGESPPRKRIYQDSLPTPVAGPSGLSLSVSASPSSVSLLHTSIRLPALDPAQVFRFTSVSPPRFPLATLSSSRALASDTAPRQE